MSFTNFLIKKILLQIFVERIQTSQNFCLIKQMCGDTNGLVKNLPDPSSVNIVIGTLRIYHTLEDIKIRNGVCKT